MAMTMAERAEMVESTIDNFFNLTMGNSREAQMVVEVAHGLGMSGASHTGGHVHFPKDVANWEDKASLAYLRGKRLYRESW